MLPETKEILLGAAECVLEFKDEPLVEYVRRAYYYKTNKALENAGKGQALSRDRQLARNGAIRGELHDLGLNWKD